MYGDEKQMTSSFEQVSRVTAVIMVSAILATISLFLNIGVAEATHGGIHIKAAQRTMLPDHGLVLQPVLLELDKYSCLQSSKPMANLWDL